MWSINHSMRGILAISRRTSDDWVVHSDIVYRPGEEVKEKQSSIILQRMFCVQEDPVRYPLTGGVVTQISPSGAMTQGAGFGMLD